jgi:hypothetical protein
MHEIAIHEAAHVVVGRIVGVYVTHIELVPGENASGRWNAASHFRHATLRPTEWAAIHYAGLVAERRVNPECDARVSAGLDMRQFDACLKGASEVTRERVMAWTEATVAAHWDEIERLAAELERCNGLYTEELRALGYRRPAPAPARDSALSRSLRGR